MIIRILTATLGVIIILLVMQQESKSNGASGALMGGGLNLFEKQKERGLAKIFATLTFYLIVLYFFFILILKIA